MQGMGKKYYMVFERSSPLQLAIQPAKEWLMGCLQRMIKKRLVLASNGFWILKLLCHHVTTSYSSFDLSSLFEGDERM